MTPPAETSASRFAAGDFGIPSGSNQYSQLSISKVGVMLKTTSDIFRNPQSPYLAIACTMLFAIGDAYAESSIYGANGFGLANIIEIDLSDADSSWIGNVAFETQAIDRDPVSGNVYYFDRGTTANRFAHYNPSTGVNTIVRTYSPAPGIFPKHMAFSPDNTLYLLTDDDRLYIVNKQNGDLSFLGMVSGLETGPDGRTGDFAFAPDGTLYLATYQSLYILNLGSLSTTRLYSGQLDNSGGLNVWSGLAYCDGMLYASNIRENPGRSDLYSIDPTSGSINRLFSLATFVNDLSSCGPSANFNRPPEMDALADTSVSEGGSTSWFVNALDPDGDDVNFSVRDLPSGANFDPQTRMFSWVPGPLDVGDHVIEFIATDDGTPGRSDSESVTVTVNSATPTQITTIRGQAGSQDTFIANQSYALRNFGGSSFLAVGSTSNNDTARGLIRWDLSSIPAGSVIVDATMSLYSYNDPSDRQITIGAHRMLRPWIEGTLNNQNRQLNSPSSSAWTESGSGLSWGSPGASSPTDRDPSALTASTSGGVGWYSWDLTSAVQKWLDGDWTNHGILLKSLNEGINNLKYFYPSEYATESLRPELVVEYVPVPIANNPPILNPIGNKAVTAQQNLTFTVTATDPDNDDLVYSADGLPPGANFNGVTRVFSWTPGSSHVGNHTVDFTVIDNGNPARSDSEEITITVNAAAPISVTLSGPSATTDTMIVNQQYVQTNFSTNTNLYIGSSNNQITRGLIRWDLSTIPAGSTIVSAEMSLYARVNVAGGQITINAYRLLRPGIQTATWNTPWETPGASGPGDRATNVLASTTRSGTGWYTWNITSAVQQWVAGSWANDGLVLVSGNESQNNARIFVPVEYQNQTLIPKLTIQYSAP
jgi:hypothetical protein